MGYSEAVRPLSRSTRGGRRVWTVASTTTILPRVVGSRQLHECPPLLRFLQQLQRRQNSLSLSETIARCPQSSSQWMWCHQHTRRCHHLQPRTEGSDADYHRRDASRFQQSGNVSHGHVAHRSNRYEQRCINLLLLKQFDPLRSRSIEQPLLRTSSDERVCLWSQLTDALFPL